MRYLALCVLFGMVAFGLASITHAQQDYTGVWTGRTSQNETITMVIEGRTLQSVMVRVHVQGGEPDWCTGDVLFLASNYETGLYYMSEGPSIDLFWEDQGAQLHLSAVFYHQEARGLLTLNTIPAERPYPCLGTGEADFAAQNGAPYDSGRPSRPTTPPAPQPQPQPTTAPGSPPAPPAAPTAAPPAAGALTLSGSGQSVTDPLVLPSNINRIRANHNGTSNFQLTALPTGGGQEELLVNEIGSYQGIVLLVASGEYFFEINADGAWTIQIEPVPSNPQPLMALSGTGDFVSDLFTPDRTGPVPYRFTHDGQSNYQVSLVCNGQLVDLAQNEIGAVDNEVVVTFPSSVTCLWEVIADGNWSFQSR